MDGQHFPRPESAHLGHPDLEACANGPIQIGREPYEAGGIVTGKAQALVTVFDVETASIGKARDLGGRVADAGELTAVTFLPDGSAIVGGDSKGMIRVWAFAPK